MNWAQTAIEQFKKMRIIHRNWRRAYSHACSMLLAAAPGEVLCIAGPSRAGKSRLIVELKNWIIGPHRVEPGSMPVVTLLATNCSTCGTFSTKSFTIRALEAVEHPFLGANPNPALNDDRLRRLERTSEGMLRPALESALEHRNTRYLFIDESQHIRYARSRDRDAAAILDSWKCLAQATKVVLVLVGAYPLLDVIRLSPHLIGRKHNIHLPRYRPHPEDLVAFQEILEAYSQHLRLPQGVSSLREWRDLLYAGSLGCIGVLGGWLREALAVAMADDAPALTLEHLVYTMKSEADLKELAREINAGEKALWVERSMRAGGGQGESQRPGQKAGRRRKPFQKNPRRYPVGDQPSGESE